MHGAHLTWSRQQWLHVFSMQPLPAQVYNRPAEKGTGAGADMFAALRWSLCVLTQTQTQTCVENR